MEKSPAVQMIFQLRTSVNVRSVHLVGSWDGYKRQLPLSMVKDGSAKPGSWKGTFRFQGSQALKLGSRYWYYYIVDGYHVSHDPAREHVTEKTTGRKLNILDVPGAPSATTKPTTKPGLSLKTQNLPSKRHSREIVQGRPMDPSRIVSPRPQKPYASRQIREADYEVSPIEDLEERFASFKFPEQSRSYLSSPSERSDCSSGPEFSDLGSSVSGSSRSSTRECRCGRVGVTRDGRRIKLDCGGARCGYATSSSSDCSDSESEDERPQARQRMQVKMSSTTRPVQYSSKPRVVERRP